MKAAKVEFCHHGGDPVFRCPECDSLNINTGDPTKCPDCGADLVIPEITFCDCTHLNRYIFHITISGIGETPDKAWDDAVASFLGDPGPTPNVEDYGVEENVA